MFGDPGGGLAALEAFQRDYLSPSSRADPSPSMVVSSPVSGLGTSGSLASLGTPGPLRPRPLVWLCRQEAVELVEQRVHLHNYLKQPQLIMSQLIVPSEYELSRELT